MHKFFLIFILLSVLNPCFGKQSTSIEPPVLYEGRFRPKETLPPEASYIPLNVDNYERVAGTIYLEAAGKSLKYPTQTQLRAERLLYHTPFKWMLILGYFVSIPLLVWKHKMGRILLITTFLMHSLVLALRSYVLLRPPVSTMSETILYVPWVVVFCSYFFRKQTFIPIAASLTAALLLLFLPNYLSLENVQPVLDSQYWLIVHVLMVVGSYGLFCLAGLYGHLILIKKDPAPLLEKTLIQLMYLGSALLIGGTILGGVWAAESWGRFWDWDPKEAWAFISSGIYLLWIHAYRFKKIGRFGLAVGSIIGLLAITFTWYGVNYILGSGLHSYGFGNGGEVYYYLYLFAEILFLISISLFNKKSSIEKKDRRM